MKGSTYMKRKIIAVLIGLLFITTLQAQEVTLQELFRPSMLKLGLMPNLDGLLDGNFAGTLRWSRLFTSSASANYSGSNKEVSETSAAAVFKAKTFSRTYFAEVNFLEFMATSTLGSGGLGYGAALSCSYTGLNESTSGYKTAQAETIYFNKDRMLHTIMPTVDFNAAVAVGQAFSLEASGAFLPYVLILETGSKLYSTYDQAIPYTLTNVCMGWKASFGAASFFSPYSNFSLQANVTGLFGTYGTIQDIVTGNIKTTIQTASAYTSLSGDASFEYRFAFLKKLLGLVPAVNVGCGLTTESFDAVSSGYALAWRAGVTIGSR